MLFRRVMRCVFSLFGEQWETTDTYMAFRDDTRGAMYQYARLRRVISGRAPAADLLAQSNCKGSTGPRDHRTATGPEPSSAGQLAVLDTHPEWRRGSTPRGMVTVVPHPSVSLMFCLLRSPRHAITTHCRLPASVTATG